MLAAPARQAFDDAAWACELKLEASRVLARTLNLPLKHFSFAPRCGPGCHLPKVSYAKPRMMTEISP